MDTKLDALDIKPSVEVRTGRADHPRNTIYRFYILRNKAGIRISSITQKYRIFRKITRKNKKQGSTQDDLRSR